MHVRAVVTLLALALSTFVYVTAETLPVGLLPLIADDLGRTIPQIGLLVTVYGFVVVLTSVPLTRITHRVPRRLLLCALLAVFVLGNAGSALVDGYGTLMVARVVVAMSQAVFWSVVTPAAAAMFAAPARPRALSVLFAGSSLGALAGVPAGTWLGQQTSWRAAFLALSVVGLLIMVVIVTLMPRAPQGREETAVGTAPDAGRYWTIVVYSALAVAGSFTVLTYINPFLTEVSGFSESAVGPLLFVRGLAGLAGVLAAAWLVARNGWLTMTAVIGSQAVALFVQWAFGTSAAASVVTLAAAGFALSAMASALGVRALETAPGSTDMATAGTSTAFNVGITAGALLGSVLIPASGVRSVALAGAVLSLLAFLVALLEPRFSTRRREAARALVVTGR
ncbi:putative MFS transporter [Actinoplanes missouriensis 431]|uniref:Putative MFS transporter n=1 Tax=Actinoplanes missouriensis (strain ATCC 14538 / DSM 43046 / CBS 188.64 / JCM 3121 / NBRC 102363 / NCIMB 12654 / NRRL B-3342 / UNCC 431) TaxID=512565 RepID=I0HE23_ACTM4|nr:MFS transporter [Actinoplanes missouriensis]BAL91260.1 putative MFS transporter [Actinoplanes missouriensis 431]